jgi:hypothetical protein
MDEGCTHTSYQEDCQANQHPPPPRHIITLLWCPHTQTSQRLCVTVLTRPRLGQSAIGILALPKELVYCGHLEQEIGIRGCAGVRYHQFCR